METLPLGQVGIGRQISVPVSEEFMAGIPVHYLSFDPPLPFITVILERRFQKKRREIA